MAFFRVSGRPPMLSRCHMKIQAKLAQERKRVSHGCDGQTCHIVLSKSTKSKAHNFRYPVMNTYIHDFITILPVRSSGGMKSLSLAEIRRTKKLSTQIR